jgi:hypothetical protein
MRLPGRWGKAGNDGTGEVRRVTGAPHSELGLAPNANGASGSGEVSGEVPAGDGPTPVQTRLQRLALVVDGARRRRSDRDVRKVIQWLGGLAIGLGFVAIVLGWYGTAHSPYLYQEIPYLISGGLLGVALVIGGGVLVRGAWSMRQVEEARRNAVAIVRSVDRLERALRSLEEKRLDEQRPEELSPWN